MVKPTLLCPRPRLSCGSWPARLCGESHGMPDAESAGSLCALICYAKWVWLSGRRNLSDLARPTSWRVDLTTPPPLESTPIPKVEASILAQSEFTLLFRHVICCITHGLRLNPARFVTKPPAPPNRETLLVCPFLDFTAFDETVARSFSHGAISDLSTEIFMAIGWDNASPKPVCTETPPQP